MPLKDGDLCVTKDRKRAQPGAMTLKNEGYIARIKEGVDDEILQKSETAAEKKD